MSVSVIIISGPNENSPKASISVYVLAANSQDGVFVRTTRPRPENNKNALVLDDEMNDLWNRIIIILYLVHGIIIEMNDLWNRRIIGQ